jgi:hypothetical protein
VASAEAFRICGLEASADAVDNDFFKRVGHPDDVQQHNTAAEITRDAYGRPISLLGTLLDITQRCSSSARSARSLSRLRVCGRVSQHLPRSSVC